MDIYNKKGYCNNIAAAQRDGKWGFVDKNDTVVIPFVYDELYQYHDDEVWFFNNRINICKDGKWGYIDAKGRVKIPFIYDYAHNFDDGFARVCLDGREVIINRKGSIVFHNRANYDHPQAITINSRTLFKVSIKSSKKKLWGIVNHKEQIVLSITYSYEQFEAIEGACSLTGKIL